MQFIPQGPDIPIELLNLHEEGRVVFFCGAGISCRAGLPSFEELVERVHEQIKDDVTDEEKELIKKHRYDAALNCLERKLADPSQMRFAVADVLKPNLNLSGAIDTHKALLTLARSNAGEHQVRLVTTNFDRVFEEFREEFRCEKFEAPFLPIPKDASWNGLVYLHGLLQEEPTAGHLRSLILTSGDFGRAYLSERWAARFVTTMLKNYAVCFVGYSLSDPVMRYLMDAIDADNADGESTNKAFIFLSEEDQAANEFKYNKSLIKIWYSPEDDYRLLHDSLIQWAEIYRKGLLGKVEVVKALAGKDPRNMLNDGSKERLLWAVSDKSGVPAKAFAEHVPTPSLGWLDVFLEGRIPNASFANQTKDCPVLPLSSEGDVIDARHVHLWHWLTRCLNDAELIAKVLKLSGELHPVFRNELVRMLSYIETLELKKDKEALDKIRKESPGQIPDDFAAKMWKLILLNRSAHATFFRLSTDELLERVEDGSVDYPLQVQLKRYFTPVIEFEKSWWHKANDKTPARSVSNKDLFWWHLELRDCESAYYARKIAEELRGRCAPLLDVLQHALKEGLDAALFVDEFAEMGYPITYDLVSIEEHSQNKHAHRRWRYVVDIIRNAWMEIADLDTQRATQIFLGWLNSSHFIFNRLALFAAKRNDVVDSHVWFVALLRDHGFLLWSSASQREVCRLLATTANKLKEEDALELSNVIAKGPPPCFLMRMKNRLDHAEETIDRMIWLRLKKVEVSGCKMSESAQKTLVSLENKYSWKLLKNQQEEFLFWSSGTGGPDFEDQKKIVLVPNTVDGICKWMHEDSLLTDRDRWNIDDNWREVSKKHPKEVEKAFCSLADKGVWYERPLSDTLSVWREGEFIGVAERLIERLEPMMPDSVFAEVAKDVANWCDAVARVQPLSESMLLRVARRMFTVRCSFDVATELDSDSGDMVSYAINHPMGNAVAAVLMNCFRGTITKGCGIPKAYKDFFSDVVTTDGYGARHGRVILSSRIYPLYLADETWVRSFLVPRMNWKSDVYEAKAMWEGFLWNVPIHNSLLCDIKGVLLETTSSLSHLAESYRGRFAEYIATMGLLYVQGFGYAEYRTMFAQFGTKELESAVQAVVDFLHSEDTDGADGDSRKDMGPRWKENVEPFINNVWPKESVKMTDAIRTQLLLAVVRAGSEFPNAVKDLDWVVGPVEDNSFLLFSIKAEGCARRFPEIVLEFVHKVIKHVRWSSGDLRDVLDEILKYDTGSLGKSESFRTLEELIRKWEASC